MRWFTAAFALVLAGCASEKLSLTPPAGVDFSGQWRLNVAESDDPQRLIQNQMGGPGSMVPEVNAPGRGGGQGGRGGPGGPGGAGPGGAGAGGPGGFGGGFGGGAVMPAVGTLSAGLRWPGKQLQVKQLAGVVVFTSDGINQVYQPSIADRAPRRPRAGDDPRPRDRNMHSPERGDGPPEPCGWDGRTLVVQAGDMDQDRAPAERRYSVTEDGQRLIEVVAFKGRSAGYTLSRVWDRTVGEQAEGERTGNGAANSNGRGVPTTNGSNPPK